MIDTKGLEDFRSEWDRFIRASTEMVTHQPLLIAPLLIPQRQAVEQLPV
jgi:hypothetical protein